jgi:hypothetical protein
MVSSDLEKTLGKAIRPKELADYLGLDKRTVIKYASRWGGVEVTPGIWRFFEKRILEVINAVQDNEKRKTPIQGKRHSAGNHSPASISGCDEKIISKGRRVGKQRKDRDRRRAVPDRYGVFGNE